MVKEYIPHQGDFIWLEFDPQAGHEQSGRRPALVVSPSKYNQRVGLAIVCPITSKIKGYPFETCISPTKSSKICGAVLSDQIKSIDWKARKATFIAKASSEVIGDTLSKLQTLLEHIE
jgi:mRNA interferase MazF